MTADNILFYTASRFTHFGTDGANFITNLTLWSSPA